jgi:hypothetical protein
MDDSSQCGRWIGISGLVIVPYHMTRCHSSLPLGFLLEFALIILIATATPDLVPRLVWLLWPETAEA